MAVLVPDEPPDMLGNRADSHPFELSEGGMIDVAPGPSTRTDLRLHSRRVLVFLGLVWALASPPLVAQGAAPAPLDPSRPASRQILMIDDGDPSRPVFIQFYNAFSQRLREAPSPPVVVYQENLDAGRLQDPSLGSEWVEWIARKYRQAPPSVIVAGNGPALRGALALRDALGEPIPILARLFARAALEANSEGRSLEGVVGFSAGDLEEVALRAALNLLPRTEVVLLVTDDELMIPRYAAPIERITQGRVRFEATVRPEIDALKNQIRSLPRNAIVFYDRVSVDEGNRVWVPYDYLNAFAPTSPRPVFSTISSHLGAGVVGGPSIDFASMGEVAAARVIGFLEGRGFDSEPIDASSTRRTVYDWGQLRRFGISRSELPAYAEVIGRPTWIWERYPRSSAIIVLLITGLIALVARMSWIHTRLREARQKAGALSRHLMRVQDNERSRIARDLHDGLCQEMSVLALDLDREALDTGSAAPSAHASRVRALVADARDIAQNLHSVPVSVMEIPDALRTLAYGYTARTSIQTRVVVTEWPEVVGLEEATVIYRIVQEALHNVQKHADAAVCDILLLGGGNDLEVSVRDNGVGFVGSAAQPGLGLLSMEERAASVGGHLTLTSAPLQGTTVTLTLPRPSAARPE
jgi:signal transduction histidine kinase